MRSSVKTNSTKLILFLHFMTQNFVLSWMPKWYVEIVLAACTKFYTVNSHEYNFSSSVILKTHHMPSKKSAAKVANLKWAAELSIPFWCASKKDPFLRSGQTFAHFNFQIDKLTSSTVITKKSIQVIFFSCSFLFNNSISAQLSIDFLSCFK